MRRVTGVSVAAVILLAGCYTLQPATGFAPDVGTNLALDINDAGRIALGGTMGPEIAAVEGRLLRADSTDYLVSVTNIRLLRGGVQVWGGEQVRISRDHVGYAYERRFSRSRSFALAATLVGGAVAFFGGRSLLGAGGGGKDDPPDDSSQVRIGRR